MTEKPGDERDGESGGAAADRGDVSVSVTLACFGAVTASVTHELNNVISIIDQVNGLLQDMCDTADGGQTLAARRLRDVQDRIARQVRRGEAIIKNLNRFAHSVDDPRQTFAIGPTLDNFAALCRRWSEQRKVELQWDLPDDKLSVTGDPYLLQAAVYVGLQDRLSVAKPGDVLRVNVATSGAGLEISLGGPDRGRASDERATKLDAFSSVCAGSWSERSAQDGLVLTIALPSFRRAS